MRYLAQELGYGDEVDFWGNVGLLHDLDFEQWPEEHCAKVQELMRERDIDERMIHAVASHGYGICCDIEPEHEMEKVLFAVDELTGLIGAAAHPLNLPVFENGAARPSFGFSIIAPRMAATSRSAAESGFAALISGESGMCAYSVRVSDFNWDVFEEGNFGGKGIINIDAFLRSVSGKIPENTVLSHDLAEGCFARAAYAADIVLYDGEPSALLPWQKRRHRLHSL